MGVAAVVFWSSTSARRAVRVSRELKRAAPARLSKDTKPKTSKNPSAIRANDLANVFAGTPSGLRVAVPKSAKAVFDSGRMTEPQITPRMEGTVPCDERSPLGAAGTSIEIKENDM